MQGAEIGVWSSQKYNHYYFLRKDKGDIFSVQGDSILMLSSDFLNKDQWQRLLINHSN